ncbi:MAG: hypothetical protein A3H31_04665 [Gallionellales bacterium RIFCSPLOWO2_02_FULL_57_47]|nr:MAG: hypothetical protein A3H31_04665 [Gallionellales bacterium RIFCSPLOWO2_02_FULL_57_47]OGT16511.1 MAG: hypothetical protein A3J49_17765 [Gallionellales bacterium RIFCSPHIGHO2_02_FULL_57_16]
MCHDQHYAHDGSCKVMFAAVQHMLGYAAAGLWPEAAHNPLDLLLAPRAGASYPRMSAITTEMGGIESGCAGRIATGMNGNFDQVGARNRSQMREYN